MSQKRGPANVQKKGAAYVRTTSVLQPCHCHQHRYTHSHCHNHRHHNVNQKGDNNKGAEVKLARDGSEVHRGQTSLEKVKFSDDEWEKSS